MKRLLIPLLLLAPLCACPQKPAEIFLRSGKCNLGTVDSRKTYGITYRILNESRTPLIITKIDVSCGCASISEYTKEPLKPSETGFIKVLFDPKSKRGDTYVTLFVRSNAKNDPAILRIEANVKPKN